MRIRRVFAVVGMIVLGAVPAAAAVGADPFGAVEVADPTWRPATNFTDGQPFAGADATGNVLLGTIYRDPGQDDQLAVYERCASGQATWQRTVLTAAADGITPGVLLVARDGTALVTWQVEAGPALEHYSSVRAPGGAWGQPQLIVSDPNVNFVQVALSDSGGAVATWADASPAGTWARIRPAGGTWGTAESITANINFVDVAMSSGGDAVVAYRGPTPGWVSARYRPAGGTWGGEQEVLRNTYQNTLKELMVEFDGAGNAVALGNFLELNDTIRVNVRTAAGWGPTNQVLDDDGSGPPFSTRDLQALVRHPQGAVAVWTRRASFDDDIVVSRLSGAGWETPQKAFDTPTAFVNANAATNDAGEILLAATLLHRPGAVDVTDVRMSIAPSLTAPWPDLTLLSPQADPGNQYRDAFAVGGGSGFAVGWGVHGGSNQRTEVVSTKPCGLAPAPTATATATATPLPLPLPSATPPPPPNPAPPTPTKPSAIADFTTLPPTSKCIRGRKLTVRFKKPPKGYVIKTVTVKVNASKVATLKAKQLKKPLYLRKLPTGTYTITVTIKLTKGSGLTERRRYTACK